ncbi:MAG: hypothetical protein KIS86_16765 [Devosia sp.]|nr:hypothetical protein [Devosia sp.]
MFKAVLSATMLLTMTAGWAPAHAGGPDEVVTGLYAGHPWTDLPPGGHLPWHVDPAIAWERGAADAGKAFLVGPVTQPEKVDTEIVASGEYEARVRAVISGKDGATYILNFGMIGDDDEDDRWRIMEVFTDDGRYLSEVLANK